MTDVVALRKKTLPALRVQYSTKEEFKSAAKTLKIMEDFKVCNADITTVLNVYICSQIETFM